MEKQDSTFHTFFAEFLDFVFEIDIFGVFPKVIFLKIYWLDSGLYLLNWKPKVVAFYGKALLPYDMFATWDMISFTYFLVRFFCFLCESCFSSKTNG